MAPAWHMAGAQEMKAKITALSVLIPTPPPSCTRDLSTEDMNRTKPTYLRELAACWEAGMNRET